MNTDSPSAVSSYCYQSINRTDVKVGDIISSQRLFVRISPALTLHLHHTHVLFHIMRVHTFNTLSLEGINICPLCRSFQTSYCCNPWLVVGYSCNLHPSKLQQLQNITQGTQRSSHGFTMTSYGEFYCSIFCFSKISTCYTYFCVSHYMMYIKYSTKEA